MQTITLTIEATAAGLEILNGTKTVATITRNGSCNYTLTVAGELVGCVSTMAAAVETATRKVRDAFNALGLAVRFTNA